MRADGAAAQPPQPDHSLVQPLCSDPPPQNENGFGTQLRVRGDSVPSLPRRSYEPHARPPGLRAGEPRVAGVGLAVGVGAAQVPFASLLGQSLHVPWYRSLAGAFRREHLPPLDLTSKPIPVAEIWGTFNYRKRSMVSSGAAHAALLAIVFTTASRHRLPEMIRDSIDLAIPVEITRFLPAPPEKGGGGGGDNSPLPAAAGVLPRFELTQLVPPVPQAADIKPRLAVSPALLGSRDVKASILDLALLGSPLDKVGPPSSGPGSGGGIGSGKGTGIGAGDRAGFGPGDDVGADRVFKVGGDVIAPELRVQVDPEYTEKARVQRLQGAVLLSIEVWPDGLAHNVRVERGLGMGLDERAGDAVRKWEFQPGTKDGKPVRVGCRVEVVFQLF
jgi:periplasmic protein TonB